MSKTHVVTLKLTETELKIVDELITWSHARSRSDIIREAILVLARIWKLGPEVRRAVNLERGVKTPRRNRHVMDAGRKNERPCGPLEPGRPY